MYKYMCCKPFQLPKCIREKVLGFLKNKKDDFLVIWHTCGYEIYMWSIDLPIEISVLR